MIEFDIQTWVWFLASCISFVQKKNPNKTHCLANVGHFGPCPQRLNRHLMIINVLQVLDFRKFSAYMHPAPAADIQLWLEFQPSNNVAVLHLRLFVGFMYFLFSNRTCKKDLHYCYAGNSCQLYFLFYFFFGKGLCSTIESQHFASNALKLTTTTEVS